MEDASFQKKKIADIYAMKTAKKTEVEVGPIFAFNPFFSKPRYTLQAAIEDIENASSTVKGWRGRYLASQGFKKYHMNYEPKLFKTHVFFSIPCLRSTDDFNDCLVTGLLRKEKAAAKAKAKKVEAEAKKAAAKQAEAEGSDPQDEEWDGDWGEDEEWDESW